MVETSNGALIRRLLRMTWRYRWGCIQVLCLQVVLLTLGLSGIGYTTVGIDVMRHAVSPGTRAPHWPFGIAPPVEWTPLQGVWLVAGAVLLFAAIRAVLNSLNQIALNVLVQGRIVVDLRAQVYATLQQLSFRFFDANASSSLINRVTGDVQSVRSFVDQILIQVIIMGISLTAYVIFMVNIHVGLTLACLASTPLLWMASASYSRVVAPAYRRNRELVDALVARLTESIRGIAVVKGFAREDVEIARFQAANDIVRDQQQWIFWRNSIFAPGIQFLSQVNLVVLLGYGGWLAARGEISVGAGLVAFAAVLQQFSGQVANIANISDIMQQSLRGARRVFEVIDAKRDIESPPNATRLAKARGHLIFDKVWFDHGDDPVLQDIAFEVRPGQCVAIVGPTGSGKSALMSLIPRFYDPVAGRVLLDGDDLRSLDLQDLRHNIGLVFQESFLFSTTVADNIAFGHPSASREQIERAARIAAAHEFIVGLPNGYDTVLGETGIGLSGGQRQRIAIARALLLEPSILLLDDPTASVDPGTEHEILEAMEAAMAGRTTFLVAHRPSMLRRADLIVVLDKGRIAQVGTHADLLRQPGYYALSAEIQTQSVRAA